MKFEKLKELVESRENLFLSDMYAINSNKRHEAILFYLSKAYLIKPKGRKDYERIEIKLDEVESTGKNNKIFSPYSYQINFKDGTVLKLYATTFKEDDELVKKLEKLFNKGEYNKKHHSESILADDGSLLALYQGKIKGRDSWLVGSADLKGWTYREDTLEQMKKEQMQDKKVGSLEQVSVEAERDNKFDSEAVKVLVSEAHVGYLPRNSEFKTTVNKLIDSGYADKITGYVNYEHDKEYGKMVDVQLFVIENE